MSITSYAGVSAFCLKANANKMCHPALGNVAVKSTLSVANESRFYLVCCDVARLLITQAKELYISYSDLEVALESNVFAIDAATID